MAFEPAIVVFDACVLYPFHLRNIVVQAAVDRLVHARWSDEIHDEWTEALAADFPAIPVRRLAITRKLMNDALPQAMVRDYRTHIDSIGLPDPKDRHVVAAAIAAGASVVLTWNLRDFPTKELAKHGLVRQTPDVFLADLYNKAPDLVLASLANARRNLRKSRLDAADFIGVVKKQGLGRLAAKIAGRAADL
jgi:hypothetical protein